MRDRAPVWKGMLVWGGCIYLPSAVLISPVSTLREFFSPYAQAITLIPALIIGVFGTRMLWARKCRTYEAAWFGMGTGLWMSLVLSAVGCTVADATMNAEAAAWAGLPFIFIGFCAIVGGLVTAIYRGNNAEAVSPDKYIW